MLIVQKFGGSSLAGAERLRRAASIIADSADAGNKVVAVVSARGDMTDELLGQARRISADPPVREIDALLSCGETGSAAMTAMQLAISATLRFAHGCTGRNTDRRSSRRCAHTEYRHGTHHA